jgi:hypothetical protein
VGPINRNSVALGVIAHSPFVADSSPGKLLVLMLARALGLQGFQDLDLTPEGTYKERIADHADEVHLLDVHFRWSDHLKARAILHFRDRLDSVLGENGLSRVRRLRQVFTDRLRGRAGGPGAEALPEEIFALTSRAGVAIGPASVRLNVNNVADLLLYRPTVPSDLSQTAFLSRALERLEAGDRAYTLAGDGVLQYCGWMGSAPAHALSDLPEETASAPGPVFLSEGIVHPAAVDPNVRTAAIAQRLHEAMGQSADRPILVAIPADDRQSAETLMSWGFDPPAPAVHKTGPFQVASFVLNRLVAARRGLRSPRRRNFW